MRLKVIALLVVGLLAGSARANVIYSYTTDSSRYQVAAPGTLVNVPIYLTETLTGGSTSLINNDGGLFGAGVGVNNTGGATKPGQSFIVPVTAGGVALNLAPIASGGFGMGGVGVGDLRSVNGDGSIAVLIENIGVPPPSSGGPLASLFSNSGGTIVNRVLLGSVTIQAGKLGSTTTFAVTSLFNSPDPILGQGNEGNTLTLFSAWDLDLDNNGNLNSSNTGNAPPRYLGANDITNTFALATIPEPSSLALIAVAGACLVLGKLRRVRHRHRA
jgi:hypothetical protein